MLANTCAIFPAHYIFRHNRNFGIFDVQIPLLMKNLVTVLAFLLICLPGFSQVVYEDISNNGIYEFLDELANLRLITLNSAIKPYSRNYIAQKLYEAQAADAVECRPQPWPVHPILP